MSIVSSLMSWILMIFLQFTPMPGDADIKLTLHGAGENSKSEFSATISKTELANHYKVVVSGVIALDPENEEKSSAEALIYETKGGLYLLSLKENDYVSFNAVEDGMPFELRKQDASHDKLFLSCDRNYVLPGNKTEKSFNYSLEDDKVEVSLNETSNQIESINITVSGIPAELSLWKADK